MPLDVWLTEIEPKPSEGWKQPAKPACLYVAQINTRAGSRIPESMIARIWNECLGPAAIPFDPPARKALIEHGRQHSELKRHIEAWEEMKDTKSKYAVGERFEGAPMPN